MRAVTVREYGGTPAVAEIPTPEPGARQILIRLRAAGMNPNFGSPPARGSRRISVDGVWCHLAFAVYGLEDEEWKIAHRYRDDNIRPDQARQ